MSDAGTLNKTKAKTAGRSEDAARVPDRTDLTRAGVPTNRAVAVGRDGKPIWRQMTGDVDKFHIDPKIIPDGWSYEWKRESVYGWEDTQHQVSLGLNGWTPVPAERHDGMFMPSGHRGAIRRDGMVMMERPMELTMEAKREDRRKANTLVNGSRTRYGMQPTAGSIADTNHPTARANTFVKADRQPVENDNKYNYALDE